MTSFILHGFVLLILMYLSVNVFSFFNVITLLILALLCYDISNSQCAPGSTKNSGKPSTARVK
jgi:hypothetical protein